MSVSAQLVDNSAKDNTGDAINGSEVDANPQTIADILDGTTVIALGTVAGVPFTAVDINGGTIDGVTIGGASAGAGTFTTLVANTSITGTLATASQPNITALGTIGSLVATTADINAGTVDAVIGGTTPAAGTFTTLAGTTSVVAASDITITSGSILSASGAITFGDENLSTTGTLGAGATTVTSLNASDGNITNVGNIALDSISADDGSSSIQVNNALFSLNGTAVANGAGSSVFNVNGTTGGATIHLTNNTTGTTNSDGALINQSGNDLYVINRESGFVQFRTADTERMRIDSNGNVGIGGTPAGTRKVEIHNSRATAYSAGNLETWADQMLWNTDGTAGSATGIAFMDRVTAYSSNGAAGIVGIRQAGDYEMDLAFIVRPNSAASAEAMRINSSGNVGIGDNDPLAKVHIKGSGTSGQVTVGQIMENTSSGTWFADIIGSAGSSRYRMGYSGGAGTGTNSMTEAFSMMLEGSGAGNVGIGGSPVSYKLEVHGSAPTLMLKSTGATDDLQLRLEQSGGPVGTIGYDDSEGLLYFNQFGNATVGLVVDSSHNVGIGKTPIGTAPLSMKQSTADPYGIVVEASASDAWLRMGHSGTIGILEATYNSTAGYTPLTLWAGGSEQLRISTSGNVFIGDTTNANMTQGLTINQGANDNEIFALKSSDMAHGVTDTTETDTFFSIRKTSLTSGGVQAQCFSEDDLALNLWGVHTNDSTTKTTGGSSTVRVTALKKNGTTIGGPGANANLFSVFNGGVGSVFIVDAEGDLYADGGTSSTNMVTQYDEYEDAQLIRAFSTMGNAQSVIKDKWDNFVSYNEDTLVELGILGAPLKDKPLYCVTKLQKLQNGAIWQLYTQIMDMAERIEENVPQLRGKLIPQIGA